MPTTPENSLPIEDSIANHTPLAPVVGALPVFVQANSRRTEPVTLAALMAEIRAAGGEPAAALAAVVSLLATQGGVNIEFAEAADLWTDELGALIVTPEVLAEAELAQTVTPAAGLLAIDGAAGWAFEGALTANVNINSIIGITGRTRKLTLLASGSARTVSCTGADVFSNFVTSVTIPAGQRGRFLIDKVGTDVCLTFAGLING